MTKKLQFDVSDDVWVTIRKAYEFHKLLMKMHPERFEETYFKKCETWTGFMEVVVSIGFKTLTDLIEKEVKQQCLNAN